MITFKTNTCYFHVLYGDDDNDHNDNDDDDDDNYNHDDNVDGTTVSDYIPVLITTYDET